MKHLLQLSIFFLISCHQNSNTSSNKSELNDSTKNISEKLDLTIIQPKSEIRKIQKNWKNLNELQNEWIEVKKDENGYLIYEPCDGNTRKIELKDGNLYIQWQIEPQYKFQIEKFTMLSDKKSFKFEAYEENTQTGFPISAKIIDSENGLVLWEFKNEMEKEKWLMTPIQNVENFRRIKNNCPDYKRSELKFIE